MKAGDLVIDTHTKDPVIILSEGVEWQETDGSVCKWDYEVMADFGSYFVDRDEIVPLREIINVESR